MNTRKMIFKSALVLQILTAILFGSVYAQEKKTDPNTIEHKIHGGDILLNGSLVNDDQGNQSIELTLLCGTAVPNKLEKLRIGITGVDPEKRVAGESTDLKLIGANQKGEIFFYLTNPRVIIAYGNDNKMKIVADLKRRPTEEVPSASKVMYGTSHEITNPVDFNRFIVNSNGDLLYASENKSLHRINMEGLEEVFKFPSSHTIICSPPATICVDSKKRAYAYAIDNNTFQYGLFLFEKDKRPELLITVKTTIPKFIDKDNVTEWAESVAKSDLPDFYLSFAGQLGLGSNENFTRLMADTMAFTLDQSDNLIIPGKATATVKDEDGNEIETKVPAIIRIDSTGKSSPLWIAKNNFQHHPYLIKAQGNLLIWTLSSAMIHQTNKIVFIDFIKRFNIKPARKTVIPFLGNTLLFANNNLDFNSECEIIPALWFQLILVERSIKIVELIGEKQKPKFGNLEVEAK